MINQEISKRIVTIGCDCSKPLGGVARVLNSYKHFVFDKFNFISSTNDVNNIYKLAILLKAIICLVFKCIFTKIEIVHIHGSSYNSFWRKRILINIAKGLRKKVIYHIHGAEFHLFYNHNKDVVKKTLKKTNAIITLSESWKHFFEQEVGVNNVKVVPNITPHIQQLSRITQDKKITHITFIGTLCERKGVYDIIQVVTDNREAITGKLIINLCGNGEVEKVEKMIQVNSLGNIIKCKGAVNSSEISHILKDSDIYILPSYNEGLPISILEAMSYTLPVISTPVGGIPEVVKDGENGFLVQPGDKEALYNAIMNLVEDKSLREKMGKISYQKVQPHFPDNVSEKLEYIYKELLNR